MHSVPRAAARPAAAARAILHVSHGGGNSNGVRKMLADLTEAQVQLGNRVALHLVGPDAFDEYADPVGAPHARVIASAIRGPERLGLSPSGERWIRSPAATAYEVLHQHGIWTANSRLTRQWRRQGGGPTVVSPHGSLEPVPLSYSPWKKRLALAAYERRNLHDATCLHATAEGEVAGFRDFGLRNPIAVIPNGAAQAWVESTGSARRFRLAHGLPAGSRLMLYLSRIHPKKNLLGLVEALPGVGAALNDWHLVVAGPVEDAAYYAQVTEAVHAHGLASRVHFLGELHHQEKRDAFAAAEVMALATLSDNFALVIAEALGAGVPVLTTEGALPWSILEERGCGWWVPNTRPDLERTLTTIARTPADRLAAMGARGRALVMERFLWADIAWQSMQLYEWLLGLAPQPGFVVRD